MKLGVVIVCIAACGFDRRELALDAPGGAPPSDAPSAIDAPPAACPAAPTGCAAFGCATSTSCYYLCPATTSWEAANLRCMMAGVGCLATIDDTAENACLATSVAASLPAWIGYVQTDTTTEPAGGWTWACRDARFTAPTWGTTGFEPNNAQGDEQCGAISDALGHWNDATCTDPFGFVCELPR